MTVSDKNKLDSIATGANKYIHPTTQVINISQQEERQAIYFVGVPMVQPYGEKR